MRNRTLLVVSFCLFALVALGPPVGAQEADAEAEPAPVHLTPEIALARLCISEAGWECFDTGDGLGIHEVILRGAEHQAVRYETYARGYARRLFGARPHDVPRLRWVGQLGPDCAEPEAWPESITHRNRDGSVEVRPHAPWRSFRARCLAAFERAAEVVASMTLGSVDEWTVCASGVHDWGGFLDEARARRIGLVPVDCGITDEGTRNTFYCRPGMARLEGRECIEVNRE